VAGQDSPARYASRYAEVSILSIGIVSFVRREEPIRE